MTRDAGRRGSKRSNGAGTPPQSGQQAPSREDRGRLSERKRPADLAGSIGKIAVLLVVAGGVGIIAYNMLRGGAAVRVWPAEAVGIIGAHPPAAVAGAWSFLRPSRLLVGAALSICCM